MGVEVEERALIWIAKEATGSMRDAYTLLDQIVSFADGSITLERIREKLGVLGIEELNDFARLLRGGNSGAVLERMDAILATGVSIEQFVTNLAEYFRNLLFLKSGIGKDTLLGYAPADFDARVLESLSLSQIEKAIELLLSLYRNIRFSLNQRFELELLLSRLAQLDAMISPADLREALREMREQILAQPGASLGATAAHSPTPGSAESQASRPEIQNLAAEEAPAADPSSVMKKIVDTLHRERPALAAALAKLSAVTREGDDIVLTFPDRFIGDVVLKDREMLVGRIAALLPGVHKLRLAYQEAKVQTAEADPKVELLRKVFRGEVVKGEGHGDQSV